MIDSILELFVVVFVAWLSGFAFGQREYWISLLNTSVLIGGIAGLVMIGGAG